MMTASINLCVNCTKNTQSDEVIVLFHGSSRESHKTEAWKETFGCEGAMGARPLLQFQDPLAAKSWHFDLLPPESSRHASVGSEAARATH